ncbi:hypothetical protein GYMLUDRAFT_49039 [Collybiopsis luxurians FD-317 M1]|uniref:Uncharacterized protein n=1 Tax=Collybiopsis luxurians FD-317 M1 TaxID=944289 RepID=A0A0D0BWM0_9AGAR|nr:hypothetical protein GYMLUDRAFT_49039 [Collybiopsis luxurians FD-317 M1]
MLCLGFWGDGSGEGEDEGQEGKVLIARTEYRAEIEDLAYLAIAYASSFALVYGSGVPCVFSGFRG